MTRSIVSGLMVTCAVTAFAAQSASQPSSASSATQKNTKMMTLTGCVGAGAGPTDPFTLSSPMIVTGNVPSNTAPPASGALPPLGTTGTNGADVNTAGTVATGYRLSGTEMKKYAGKRVQIAGGLVPSPNAAATAGASSSGVVPPTGVDGAINSAPRTPSAVVSLPEFQVLTVRPIPGPCPVR